MAADNHKALFKELAQRFKALKKTGYARLDAEADANIKRWRYAERAAFDLQVDGLRRAGEEPGVFIDEEPTKAYSFHAYGYDSADRIIYSAEFQMEEVPRLCSFYSYTPDYIEAADFAVQIYTENFHLQRVARLVGKPGEPPTLYANYGDGQGGEANTVELYQYDDKGRMARIVSTTATTPPPLTGEMGSRFENMMDQQRRMAQMLGTESQMPDFEKIVRTALTKGRDYQTEHIYEYDGDNLKRIISRSTEVYGDGEAVPTQSHTLYEAPRPGETDEQLFEAARSSLHDAIIDHVVRFDPALRQQMPMYNLSISYDAVADDGLMIIFGTQKQREKWEATTDERNYHNLVFSASVYDVEYTSLWELPEAYDRFLRNFRKKHRWDDIRKLLVQVARDLNRYDWSKLLITTDDFIVFADDHEAMEDIETVVIDCAPEEKIQILRAKGLLD